jgi:hypothetical protein
MSEKVKLPKNQVELLSDSSDSYTTEGYSSVKTPPLDLKNPANQIRRDNDDVKNFQVGIADIDESIHYYFTQVIKPRVEQNGEMREVPILYGNPERWNSIQKNGHYRDRDGKIQFPLIVFRRVGLEKNRNLGNKLDANHPLNYGVFRKKYSKKNAYNQFDVLNNRKPAEEFYAVAIPDYVNITYECIIFTNYTEQNNKIIEGINYASDSYWGDNSKFKFRAQIDSYSDATEVGNKEARVVKTTFQITLLGYIVTDAINAHIHNTKKLFSKSALKVDFNVENRPFTILSPRADTDSDAIRVTLDQPSLATVDISGIFSRTGSYYSTTNNIRIDGDLEVVGTTNFGSINFGFTAEQGSGVVNIVDQSLNVVGGEGIDTSASSQTITISGENASDSNKGIASFNSTNFTVISGNVISNNLSFDAGSGLTGGGDLTLGGSTTVNVGEGEGITVNPDNVQLRNANSLLNNTFTKWDSLNDQLVNSIINDNGNQATIEGNLQVKGDFIVSGSFSYLNTSNLYVEDKFILLNSGSANPDEGGIIIDEGSTRGHAFVYDSDFARFAFTGSLSSTATSVTPDAFAASVIDVDVAGHADVVEYQKPGNIKVEGGEVWIYT